MAKIGEAIIERDRDQRLGARFEIPALENVPERDTFGILSQPSKLFPEPVRSHAPVVHPHVKYSRLRNAMKHQDTGPGGRSRGQRRGGRRRQSGHVFHRVFQEHSAQHKNVEVRLGLGGRAGGRRIRGVN